MKYFSVLVTYNPEIIKLKSVLKSILINNCNLIIVDNGSLNIGNIKDISNGCKIIQLDKNVGIAKAQNIGIKSALLQGADYVWLSDQDTIYRDDFIQRMSICIKELNTLNIKYSVIGPAYEELNTGLVIPFIRYTPFTTKVFPKQKIHFVDQVISSGMIIPAPVFKQIGYMNEDLFIDWVDFEWCWRSLQKGYKVIGCGDVKISHVLGDNLVQFLGKKIIVRSSFRHYFMIRNAIYLSLYSNYLSIPTRIEIFIRTTLWAIIYPMCSPNNKLKHMNATFMGFIHGLIAKLNPDLTNK